MQRVWEAIAAGPAQATADNRRRGMEVALARSRASAGGARGRLANRVSGVRGAPSPVRSLRRRWSPPAAGLVTVDESAGYSTGTRLVDPPDTPPAAHGAGEGYDSGADRASLEDRGITPSPRLASIECPRSAGASASASDAPASDA